MYILYKYYNMYEAIFIHPHWRRRYETYMQRYCKIEAFCMPLFDKTKFLKKVCSCRLPYIYLPSFHGYLYGCYVKTHKPTYINHKLKRETIYINKYRLHIVYDLSFPFNLYIISSWPSILKMYFFPPHFFTFLIHIHSVGFIEQSHYLGRYI